jgi:lysophospholipase L1-like esterase
MNPLHLERRQLLIGAAVLATACRDAPEEIAATPMSLDAKDLDSVLRAKVFFGHQSVGANILDGIRAIIAPRTLSWTDAMIGTNEQPLSKLEAFRGAVTAGAGKGADVALMKFCYVDFNAGTNVASLFDTYKKTMAALKAECPSTTFVHVTVPLTTVASGAKAWVKKRIGSPVWGELENDKRHAYNELLRAEYRGKEPVFDLAAVESGDPARPQRFELDGKSVPMLAASLTDDGGHLNATGRRVVAQELLSVLAKLPARGS